MKPKTIKTLSFEAQPEDPGLEILFALAAVMNEYKEVSVHAKIAAFNWFLSRYSEDLKNEN